MGAVSVSIVIPCRNEKPFIASCVQSVLQNDFAGTIEILVVDGMSDDGTREIIEEMCRRDTRVRLLDNASRDTASAMNLGIQKSGGEVVLILGAHSELSSNYIGITVARLLSAADIGCVGGRVIPVVRGTNIMVSIGDVQRSPFGVGNSLYRIPGNSVREVDTVAYGAYRREALDRVGFFDVSLTRNQDIEFNSRIRRAGFRIVLDPKAVAYYHPRTTLRSFCRQSFGNGFWNIETWKTTPGSLSWRHFVPLTFVLALSICGIGSIWFPACRWLLMSALGQYLLLDLAETIKFMYQRRKAGAAVTFLVFPALHFSYGVGSLVGLFALLSQAQKATKQKNRAAVSDSQ